MPTAPTLTHAAWAQNQPLSGTLKRFSIMLRWSPVVGATSFDVNITVGSDSVATSTGTTNPCFWWDTDEVPEDGDTAEIITVDGGGSSTPTVLSLTPIVVTGATEVFTAVGANVFSGFNLGPTRPTDWEWTLSGAPEGLSITAHTGGSDGGIIVGSTAVEGVFDATVGITNYNVDANVVSAQNYAVKIHVSGERYLADFHSDPTRTGLCIRHTIGTVASWNLNAQSELPLTLGDSPTVHAILRNGTGYLDSGVTNLKLVAKLPSSPDSPAVLKAESASPTMETFDSVEAWPLTVSVEGDIARRIFSNANVPTGAAPASLSQVLDAQISYTHGGKTHRSQPFKIRLFQPIAQL